MSGLRRPSIPPSAPPAPLATLATLDREQAAVFYANDQGRPIGERWFASQRTDGVSISIRAIVVDALALDARTVVLAHNHPSGVLEPSIRDLRLTRTLFATLQAIGIRLHDHFIVSGAGWMSFRDAGLL